MIRLRLLLIAWLSCGITCAAWPWFHGWADWPASAQRYAEWATYNAKLLPFAGQAWLSGICLLLLGAGLLFFRRSVGGILFVAGLVLHGYSKCNAIPTIAESRELGILALFYILSGCIVATTVRWSDSPAIRTGNALNGPADGLGSS